MPLAVNCAPFLANRRKKRSPLLSMNVISLRSTIQARRTSVRWFFFQHALNSCTQGWTSRPCRIHLSSAGVSLKVIFNMAFSSGRAIGGRLSDSQHDILDVYVISFSVPHCSCCTSPEAQVPLAANRRGRKREFRRVRCESQTLADEFRPGLCRSGLFLLRPPTEKRCLACSDRS